MINITCFGFYDDWKSFPSFLEQFPSKSYNRHFLNNAYNEVALYNTVIGQSVRD